VRWIQKVEGVLIAGALLCTIVLTQIAVGAYHTERGNYSDEATHFLNGLLVRDYLTHGLGQNPVSFAEQYYVHYPKIAPGMWPPFFHVTLGLFLLPGWPAQDAALLLVACFTAWAAWRLLRISTIISGRAAGVIVAFSFVGTASVIGLGSTVMLDVTVAALALEATYWLAVYVTTRSLRHAALFGVFAALCCLTKGNGLAVLLVPPLFVLFTGRFALLRAPGLYVAALIVLILAAPLVAIAYRLDAGIGDFSPTTVRIALGRTAFYARYLFHELGVLPAFVIVVGTARSFFRSPKDCQITLPSILPAALTALAAAAWLFHAVNPHVGIAGRYMTMAIAPLLALAPLGIGLLVNLLVRAPERRGSVATASMLLVAGLVVSSAFPLARHRPFGWREILTDLEGHGSLAGRRIAVISDEGGEGALVAELASQSLQPMPTIIRGSKLLASDNWNGLNLHLTYSSSAQVLRELEDLHVEYLILDLSNASTRLPYWDQVADMVSANEDRLAITCSTAGDHRLVAYKLLYQSPGPGKKLRIATSSNRIVVEQ
jgi:hypothetical protein